MKTKCYNVRWLFSRICPYEQHVYSQMCEANKARIVVHRKIQTWSLFTADLSRYKSTLMHFSSNFTPSSKVRSSRHSSRRIGRARWLPKPVVTWLSSKVTPIILTWIKRSLLLADEASKLKIHATNLFESIWREPKIYRAKILLPILHPT